MDEEVFKMLTNPLALSRGVGARIGACRSRVAYVLGHFYTKKVIKVAHYTHGNGWGDFNHVVALLNKKLVKFVPQNGVYAITPLGKRVYEVLDVHIALINSGDT